MIAVACGVLVNARGEVLIAQRPVGKIAAGKWEFPGGKIESGESAREALQRELHEELSIQILVARPLIHIRHDYSDRTVLLDTWLISGWAGSPEACEGQSLAWCAPARLFEYDLLAADGPIVNALRLPADYVFTPPQIGVTALLQGLERLPRAALLRLRLPALDGASYSRLASQVIAQTQGSGLQVILDREPQQAAALGAAGWHCSSARLAGLSVRPVAEDLWFCGSAHDAQQLQRLRRLGGDCAVLGPVLPTATHPGQPALGWKEFHSLSRAANLPLFAIGGVGPQEQVLAHECYAQGTAGISAYWGSEGFSR